jgi:hypothetical protein
VQPQQHHFWMCSNNHLNVSKEYYIEAETENPVSRILQILPECLDQYSLQEMDFSTPVERSSSSFCELGRCSDISLRTEKGRVTNYSNRGSRVKIQFFFQSHIHAALATAVSCSLKMSRRTGQKEQHMTFDVAKASNKQRRSALFWKGDGRTGGLVL